MCEDVWKGFIKHFELLNVRVVVSYGLQVLAFPGGVRESTGVCSAHETDVGVV